MPTPRKTPSTWLYALAAVVATLTGTAAAHLVAAATNPAASPVLAVGSAVIDATPTPLKEWAISNFGTKDKPILLGSVLLVVLLLAVIAGVVTRRSFVAGAGMLVGLVALAGAAALLRPEADAIDALPALTAAVVGVASLWLLVGRRGTSSGDAQDAPEHATEVGTPKTNPSRRGVLLGSGALAVGAVAMGAGGQWLTRLRATPANVSLPAAAKKLGALATGLEGKIKGLTPFRTPNADFYRVDTRTVLPIVNVDDWTLTIDGDVDKEVSFTFDEIRAMDLVERDITMTCVSNDVGGSYVGAARWLGVPLTVLLDRAGIDNTKADQILSTDVDGMTISTPLAVALDGREPLLAIGMNGEALPQAHGFPARLVTPGIYGYVGSTKWVTRLTLTTYDDEQAYWTERKWATDAPIKIASRIDTPVALSTSDAGEVTIAGVAWAQQRGGIGKVEVRIDGGPWQQAKLGPDAGIDYWRQWYLAWDAAPGQHRLAVRATTTDGEQQSTARAKPFPDGSSGIQELLVNIA